MELPPSPITQLPPEILIDISNLLPIRSILSLSATCKTINPTCLSEDVMRKILSDAIGRYVQLEKSSSYYDQVRFILPLLGFVGFFLSTTPYNSRLINTRITYQPSAVDSNLRILTLSSYQIVPRNLYTQATTPVDISILPFGATLDPGGVSYSVPRVGPGSFQPDNGLSVDLLDPAYSPQALFEYNASASSISGVQREGRMDWSPRVQLVSILRELKNLDAGEEGAVSDEERRRRESDALFELWTGREPSESRSWPTRNLIGSEMGSFFPGALRPYPDWLSRRGEMDGPIIIEQNQLRGFQILLINSIKGVKRSAPAPSTRTGRLVESVRNAMFMRTGEVQENGGFIYALQREAQLPRQPNAEIELDENEEEEEIGEEIVRGQTEQFFHVAAPDRPLSYRSPISVSSSNDILLASLEGIWIGTFGGHGLEFLYVSPKLVPLEDAGPGDGLSYSTAASTRLPSGRYKRVLQACKMTGDTNVPSGEVSWIAELGEIDIDRAGEAEFGTIPSVTNESLLQRSREMNPVVRDDGVAGQGQIAMTGYINSSWTPATITFIRSTHKVSIPSSSYTESESSTREIDVVDEIRLRWAALGKVGNFRRVRL